MVYEPPPQHPAGWYPDPHVPGNDRYWNGQEWEERWRPSGGAAAFASTTSSASTASSNDLPDIGEWLTRAFNRALARWRAAAIVALLTNAIPLLLFFGAAAYLVDGVIITPDDEVIGWSNDRLPLAIALGVIASVLGLSGMFAMQALMIRAVDESEAIARGDAASIIDEDDTPATRALDAIGTSIRTLPRAIGWFIVTVLGMVAAAAVISVLLVVAAPIGVIAIVAAIPLVIFLTIRWAFVGVAIVDGPGNPFTRSADTVRGRWWAMFGRLLLIGLIFGILTAAINSTSSVASGSDGFGNQITVEVDADGRLTGDLALADFLPSTIWTIILTVVGQLVVNVMSTVGIAGMTELYRTRHPARTPTGSERAGSERAG